MDIDTFYIKYNNDINRIINIITLNTLKLDCTFIDYTLFQQHIFRYIYYKSSICNNKKYILPYGNIKNDDYFKMDNLEYFEELHRYIIDVINSDILMSRSTPTEFAMIILSYIQEKYKEDPIDIMPAEMEADIYNEFI